jgi:serine/threonine protein kinase
MEFTPQTTLTIRGKHYTFAPKPRSNDKVFIDSSGGRAAIYKLHCQATNTFHALKVFKPGFIDAYDRANFEFFQERLPEMNQFAWVKQRMLLNSNDDTQLLTDYPHLKNAIVMPWIDLMKLDEIRGKILDGEITASPKKCRHFAQLLAHTLAELERQGIAHGDIASTNILFDWDHDELYIIDIEDMYHESLTKPTNIAKGGGTPGYRFDNSFTSWSPFADRFAGAIMISEILSLVSENCNKSSAEECYFTQVEISQRFNEDTDSYQALYDAIDDLNNKWSQLLDRSWNETNLSKLPTLTEWETTLGRPTQFESLYQQWIVVPEPTPEPVVEPDSTPIIEDVITQIHTLINQPDTPTIDTIEDEVPQQKPEHEWYTKAADSDHPALFVFLLDLSRSMYKDELKVNTSYRYEIAEQIINNTIDALVQKSLKGTSTKPRYHIAIIGYNKKNANILQKVSHKISYTPSMNNRKSVPANTNAGIYPIGALDGFEISNDIVNLAIPAGGDMLRYPDGETYMIQAFDSVYTLIKAHIASYWECHPPYVFHITDGANNQNGDLVAAFERLTSLGTAYGNTLISTAYIGDNLINADSNWSGITSRTVFTNQRAEWAYKLRQISSKMPASFRAAIKKELNRDMDPDAYLFFPGTDKLMLNAAITAAVSTGSGAQSDE